MDSSINPRLCHALLVQYIQHTMDSSINPRLCHALLVQHIQYLALRWGRVTSHWCWLPLISVGCYHPIPSSTVVNCCILRQQPKDPLVCSNNGHCHLYHASSCHPIMLPPVTLLCFLLSPYYASSCHLIMLPPVTLLCFLLSPYHASSCHLIMLPPVTLLCFLLSP
jgi:hypothetical protein